MRTRSRQIAIALVLAVVSCHDGRQVEDRCDICDGGFVLPEEPSTPEPGECPLNYQCFETSLGHDGDSDWDLDGDANDGVRLDQQVDALMLDTASIVSYFIWVANTAEGSVSKIDVRTFEQVGRYFTGEDPSRTSVDTLGDVYIGNRQGLSLVKISTLGDDCPDTNGDGRIRTSRGSELLPYGLDDCVLWRTDLSHPTHCGLIRAVAAQDEVGPDGEVIPYVWVGGDGGCIWKLDGETGEILIDATPAPVAPYGFALDADGNLWIESVGGRDLGRLDTTRCRDLDSCPAFACDDDRGDSCIMERIAQPVRGYGITVDSSQRVWIGGSVARYDPSLPRGERWAVADTDAFVHGIAADARGWVWGAAYESVIRIDAEDPSSHWLVVSARGRGAKGAAVDDLGQVWIINQRDSDATVIIPGRHPGETQVLTRVAPVFSSPYTYSDMTGSQLRLATRPRAYYRHVFSGCEWEDTIWVALDFDAWIPTGTQVSFRARTAETRTDLDAASWMHMATVPSDETPVSLETAFAEAGVAPGHFIELEVQMATDRVSNAYSISPEVFEVTVSYRCYAFFG
jgi:hypothetical protein